MSLNEKRLEMVKKQISDSDVVCDIGGGQKPLDRADYVVDIQSFDEGFKAGVYGQNIRVDKNRWIQLDITREKMPFIDNYFDFIFCTHVLEDLYNPFHALDEISRIGRRGYIETPSARWELSKGVCYRNIIGGPHHKWIVLKDHGKLVFVEKNQLVYKHGLHISKRGLNEENSYVSLFWEKQVDYEIKCFVHHKDFTSFIKGLIKTIKFKI